MGIGLKSTPEGGFEWADISPEANARKVRWVREAAGDRWEELDLHTLVNVCAITADPARAAQTFLDGFRAPDTVGVEDLLASPLVLLGSEGAIVDMVQQRRETYWLNYVTVRSSVMEAFAPVAAQLAGT